MRILQITAVVALFIGYTVALENGIGKTPQMGWNTWNKYACNITESLIKKSAD